jgi:hypothetical protein
MFEPVRTGGFGVSGHLVLAGTFEIGEVDYWYHTPFYWLVEENGEVILREGSRDQDVGRGESAGALRMLSKPVFFASKLGLRIESYEGKSTTHRPTGRPAIEVSVHGSPAGLTATGTMVVDSETAIVLSVAVPDGFKPDPLITVETTRFAVHDTMDATLFGAETLDAAGYYSAYYYGQPGGADPGADPE